MFKIRKAEAWGETLRVIRTASRRPRPTIQVCKLDMAPLAAPLFTYPQALRLKAQRDYRRRQTLRLLLRVTIRLGSVCPANRKDRRASPRVRGAYLALNTLATVLDMQHQPRGL